MTHAAAPTRATKSLQLSFGPMTLPCSVYTGSETIGVKRSEFIEVDNQLHPVGRMPYDKITGEPIASDSVVRLLEVQIENDEGETESRLVQVSDEEVEALVDFPAGTAEIVKFLPLKHLASGHYVTRDIYQVRPQLMKVGSKKIPNEPVEKRFALLLKSMRTTGTFALVKFTLRGAPQYGALLSTGRLYTLRFDGEIRRDRPLPSQDVGEDELAMMTQIVSMHVSDDPVEIDDEVSARVLAYAQEKAAGAEPLKSSVKEDTKESLEDLAEELTRMMKGDQ